MKDIMEHIGVMTVLVSIILILKHIFVPFLKGLFNIKD